MSTRKRTALDWTTLVLLLLNPIWLAARWSRIPPQIPMHFNLAGQPNRTGHRVELWLLPLLAAGLYGLLTVVMRSPGAMNLPVPLGDPRRPAMERMGVELLLWVRLLLVAGFAWTTLLLSGGVSGLGGSTPTWTLALLPLGLVALVGVFLSRMVRRG